MRAETLYRLTFDEQEMDSLFEIMITVIDQGLVEGHALAMARAFVDATTDEPELEDEPQVMLN